MFCSCLPAGEKKLGSSTGSIEGAILVDLSAKSNSNIASYLAILLQVEWCVCCTKNYTYYREHTQQSELSLGCVCSSPSLWAEWSWTELGCHHHHQPAVSTELSWGGAAWSRQHCQTTSDSHVPTARRLTAAAIQPYAGTSSTLADYARIHSGITYNCLPSVLKASLAKWIGGRTERHVNCTIIIRVSGSYLLRRGEPLDVYWIFSS